MVWEKETIISMQEDHMRFKMSIKNYKSFKSKQNINFALNIKYHRTLAINMGRRVNQKLLESVFLPTVIIIYSKNI